jgi:hypothetical protein
MSRAVGAELVALLGKRDLAIDRPVEILGNRRLETLGRMAAERISNIEMMTADLNLHERPSSGHYAI